MIDIEHLARTASPGSDYHVDRLWLIDYTCKVLEAAANAAYEAAVEGDGLEACDIADDAFNAVMKLRP